MLSIITPSFGQLEYLIRCANSVADQKLEGAFEHIVQDGGTDGAFQEWMTKQSFAHVYVEQDAGMYDAINRGFRKSKGDIIAWLNCDEQYLPGTLEKVARWFADHPDKDILFGDVILISPDGVPLSYRKAILPILGHIRNCFLPTYSAATFVRRRVLDAGYFLDARFRSMADLIWIEALLADGYRCGLLNEPLAVFTQTGNNLGQSSLYANEGKRWKAERGIELGFSRHFWNWRHRFRKLVFGCYWFRRVSVDLYIEGERRVTRKACVGGGWKTL
jgi:glycosyltransferase involved in cell wall biosynthesis